MDAHIFQSQCTRRFGEKNPTRMDLEFWRAMVESGESAYRAHCRYRPPECPEPVWGFQRFGQSRTRVAEQVVCIAGAHEDHYDPDFCIYNDVIVVDDLAMMMWHECEMPAAGPLPELSEELRLAGWRPVKEADQEFAVNSLRREEHVNQLVAALLRR